VGSKLIVAGLGLALLAGCNRDPGAPIITEQGCGSCHEIPGIEGAEGAVGPSLKHFGSQRMIAGTLPNTPANLQRYLMAPQMVVPGNVMPNTGLTAGQARAVAAYLGRLE
jgi:cytochrome c1